MDIRMWDDVGCLHPTAWRLKVCSKWIWMWWFLRIGVIWGNLKIWLLMCLLLCMISILDDLYAVPRLQKPP